MEILIQNILLTLNVSVSLMLLITVTSYKNHIQILQTIQKEDK